MFLSNPWNAIHPCHRPGNSHVKAAGLSIVDLRGGKIPIEALRSVNLVGRKANPGRFFGRRKTSGRRRDSVTEVVTPRPRKTPRLIETQLGTGLKWNLILSCTSKRRAASDFI